MTTAKDFVDALLAGPPAAIPESLRRTPRFRGGGPYRMPALPPGVECRDVEYGLALRGYEWDGPWVLRPTRASLKGRMARAQATMLDLAHKLRRLRTMADACGYNMDGRGAPTRRKATP